MVEYFPHPPFCDNFEHQFLFSAVQFTLMWSLKQSNSGTVVTCILGALREFSFVKIWFGSILQPVDVGFETVTDTPAAISRWCLG